jgi:hypothetical protein
MPQAVQIETEAEQQSLAHLHTQAAAWASRRELAFDRREDALDQSTAAVEPDRKRPPHFGTHAAHAPSFLSALGRDHTLRSKFLPDCRCDSSRYRIPHPSAPARWVFAAQPFRRPLADSRSHSTDRVLHSATTGTADPNLPRSPTSTNAAMAAAFARDGACDAQRTC